ncbi:MAG: hypothetical protein JSV59_07220 [Flavobacteriaceae bacterium]|nr:MAG: hypothetical protein JSV59_07220 [Flavobacteriaceae bacterium]
MKSSATFNYLFTLLVAMQIINISCSSNDNSIGALEVSSPRTIDPKLVGTWNATIDGTSGSGTATFTLQENGQIFAQTDSQVLCPFQGAWWVSDKKFAANGEDECGGNVIELFGNSTSSTEISGNWTAGREDSGSFSMTKQ